MYLSAIIREEPIEIRYAKGNTNIPLLLKSNIEDRINRKRSNDRPKIGFFFIGGIQILIKAHFREEIDSSVNLVVLDNRIKY